MNDKLQMDLMEFGGISQDSLVLSTFTHTRKQADSGAVSQSLKLKDRKTVARANGLVANKDNKAKIDALFLQGRDALKSDLAALFARLSSDPKWTGGNLRIATSKSGKSKISFILEEANRPSGKSIADIAARYGKTEEEILDMIASQLKASAEPIDVPSETTPEAAPAEETEQQKLEREEAEFKAALEAEEAAKAEQQAEAINA